MSRDEQNVLVVSYNELKKAFNKCYQEVAKNPPAIWFPRAFTASFIFYFSVFFMIAFQVGSGGL